MLKLGRYQPQKIQSSHLNLEYNTGRKALGKVKQYSLFLDTFMKQRFYFKYLCSCQVIIEFSACCYIFKISLYQLR